MQNRHSSLEIVIVLAIACVAILTYLVGNAGIWEPWEATTLLLARQLSQTNITEAVFWVPVLDGEIAYRPYLQLWLLAAAFHLVPDPGTFLLRLPSALAGIGLVLLTFVTMRRAATRFASWASVFVLLSLPCFVFSSKLIQGGIWPVFAVSLPILHYLLAVYAKTRREARVFRCFFALSLGISFLAGGLWALAIVGLTFLVGLMMSSHHPMHDAFIRPFCTRYFLFPLYIVFIVVGFFFGQYMIHVREILEEREGITVVQLNDALEAGNVETLEKRGSQIIGRMNVNARRIKAFVLADSGERLNTQAEYLLKLDDVERRRFDKLSGEYFGTLGVGDQSVSIMRAMYATVRFFWRYVDHVREVQNVPLARVRADVLKNNPELAIIRQHSSSASYDVFGLESMGYDGGLGIVHPGEIVQRVDGTMNDKQADTSLVEIRSSRADGYLSKDVLEPIVPDTSIEWKDWGRIFSLGLFPWIALWPLMLFGAFAAQKNFEFGRNPFKGEFIRNEDEASCDDFVSPFQRILFAWSVVSLVALWFGINFNGFHEYVGVIAIAMLFGLALSSHANWNRILNDGLLKVIFWGMACAIVYVAIQQLVYAPFYLIQHLLIDPLMNWPKNYTIFETTFWAYVPIYMVLLFLAFSHIGDSQVCVICAAVKNRFTSNTSDKSGTSLIHVTQGSSCEGYRPACIVILAALISAGFIYSQYLPTISQELTETALVDHFVSHSGHGEKLYILQHETERMCATYSDCDPGYICKDAQCRLSTFTTYALSVAQPISRTDLLDLVSPNATEKAYFIIPHGALYELNQTYRETFRLNERKNLIVTKAPSSRLYLLTNDENQESVNPLENIILDKVPDNATPVQVKLSQNVDLEAFRMERFVWEPEGSIDLTLYYRVLAASQAPLLLQFSVEWAGHKLVAEHPLDKLPYPSPSWLEGDVIADAIHIPLYDDQVLGKYEIKLCVHEPGETCAKQTTLTTIQY